MDSDDDSIDVSKTLMEDFRVGFIHRYLKSFKIGIVCSSLYIFPKDYQEFITKNAKNIHL